MKARRIVAQTRLMLYQYSNLYINKKKVSNNKQTNFRKCTEYIEHEFTHVIFECPATKNSRESYCNQDDIKSVFIKNLNSENTNIISKQQFLS